MMHQELVEKRKWISEQTFLHGLNFCMLLPGPEAQQLSVYLGWRLHGIRGGIAAGLLFILPSVLILLGLSVLYQCAGHIAWVSALFQGFAPAVIAIIFSAVWRIGKKTLKTPLLMSLAALSFLFVFFQLTSFLVIMAGAAIIGLIAWRWFPTQITSTAHAASEHSHESTPPPSRSKKRTLTISAVCLLLWALPLLVTVLVLGPASHLLAKALFFSKAALVTFGGAYAVLPYVAEHAVTTHAWLSHDQMMTGLALAETTPGPLIMVLQFVGFISGWQHPDAMNPWLAATIGALLTTWVTFLPSFLFVLVSAPYIERASKFTVITSILGAITACVVGQIFHLGITFSQHALWSSNSTQINIFVAVMAVASGIAIIRFSISPLTVLLVCALASLLLR